jgi:hypothetical protein
MQPFIEHLVDQPCRFISSREEWQNVYIAIFTLERRCRFALPVTNNDSLSPITLAANEIC